MIRCVFTEIFGKFVTSQRADVGIGPYRALANPYCLANFERNELAVHKPENVNRNFRILGPVPVGNAVAKIGRFMYNTEKDYVALRLLNRRDSYQKERQI